MNTAITFKLSTEILYILYAFTRAHTHTHTHTHTGIGTMSKCDKMLTIVESQGRDQVFVVLFF